MGLDQQSGVPVQPLIGDFMNELYNRRDILKYAALVQAVSFASRPEAQAVAAGFSPIKRVPGARLKLAVNAFSFLELLVENGKDASKGIDLFGVCDFCATHGCDGVDLTGYFFPGYPKAPDDNYLFKLKRHAFDRGLAITGTGVRNDFTAADKAIRAEGVQRIKTWIEVAAKLGAPVVRAFADSQPPHKNWHEAAGNASRETVESWMADSLIECAEHGQKFGVIVAVQNHGDFINTGEQHHSLLKKVDHEWCAALVDTGKYLTDDPYADIAIMAPYAVNWQIKETLGSKVDSPRTDMKRLVGIIKDSGYCGYLPIETLSMKRKNYDPFVEVPKMIAELREAIGK